MLQTKVYVKRFNKVFYVESIRFDTEVIEVYNEDRCCYSFCDFDEVEFMENTGYKDKNGNGICEGDVVKYQDDGKDEDLKGGIFTVIKEHSGTSYYLDDKGFYMNNLRNSYQDIIVIGNIYENKELVE